MTPRRSLRGHFGIQLKEFFQPFGVVFEAATDPEVVVKVRVVAGNGFAIGQVFCLQAVAVRSEDELGLVFGSGGTLPQGGEGGGDCTGGAHLEVNVVALEHAPQIRLVRAAFLALEPLDSRGLVAEGFQKSKGKLVWVKGGFSKLGNGFFNLNSIHTRTMMNISGAATQWLDYRLLDKLSVPAR